MRLTIDIKPYKTYTSSNVKTAKDQIYRYLPKYTYLGVTSNIGLAYHNDDYVYVYNIEKRRIKRKRSKTGRLKVISPTSATVTIYRISTVLLKEMGLYVKQHNRHYTISKKK